MMVTVIFLFVLSVIGLPVVAYSAYERKFVRAVMEAILVITVLTILTFGTAPFELGYGHVTPAAEAYSKRLESGIPYQTISATKDGKTQILLLKKDGTSDVMAVRVSAGDSPPEHFVLVGEKPVAITVPAPTK